MKNDKQKYLKQLLGAIEVQNRVVTNSQNFDKATKEAFINYSKHLIELTKNKLTLNQLKSLTSQLLIFWKESIGPDVEVFWTELQNKKIAFERKDELNFALQKGIFRRVDQVIAARKFWNTLKNLDTITDRFSVTEIKRIGKNN